eukprot:scaffold69116_cov74-Phaeocystis_antarctica.AAC.2
MWLHRFSPVSLNPRAMLRASYQAKRSPMAPKRTSLSASRARVVSGNSPARSFPRRRDGCCTRQWATSTRGHLPLQSGPAHAPVPPAHVELVTACTSHRLSGGRPRLVHAAALGEAQMRGGECAQLQRFQRHQIQTQHEHQTVGSAARQLGGPGKPRAAADRERLRRRLGNLRFGEAGVRLLVQAAAQVRAVRGVEDRSHLRVPRVHEDVDAVGCVGADEVREVAGGEQAHVTGASVRVAPRVSWSTRLVRLFDRLARWHVHPAQTSVEEQSVACERMLIAHVAATS